MVFIRTTTHNIAASENSFFHTTHTHSSSSSNTTRRAWQSFDTIHRHKSEDTHKRVTSLATCSQQVLVVQLFNRTTSLLEITHITTAHSARYVVQDLISEDFSQMQPVLNYTQCPSCNTGKWSTEAEGAVRPTPVQRVPDVLINFFNRV
eukprot:m.170239 g.170239  ORF g.170239 m.170239 type:complete len:149 (+) comp14525_c0_seq1:61-507(+)